MHVIWSIIILEPYASFPTNSHGILFAIVELIGSLLIFTQIPITDAVKLNQDFDLLTYTLIGTSFIIVLRNSLNHTVLYGIILFRIIPLFIMKFNYCDGGRSTSFKNSKVPYHYSQ